jgi:hypothetical protein
LPRTRCCVTTNCNKHTLKHTLSNSAFLCIAAAAGLYMCVIIAAAPAMFWLSAGSMYVCLSVCLSHSTTATQPDALRNDVYNTINVSFAVSAIAEPFLGPPRGGAHVAPNTHACITRNPQCHSNTASECNTQYKHTQKQQHTNERPVVRACVLICMHAALRDIEQYINTGCYRPKLHGCL